MAFFAGSPLDESNAHDDLAARIGNHSSTFVEQFWRWEDMQAYVSSILRRSSGIHVSGLTQVFRLLLEYARALYDDRQEMSFSL